MKFKRGLAILLTLCMVFALVACNGSGNAKTTTTADNGATTTVNQGAADDVTTTVVTDEGGETVTTTVVTDESGNEITTTTVQGVTNNQGSNNKTTTTKRTTRTRTGLSTVTLPPQGTTATFADLVIPEGKDKADKGLDFKGQTFTHAKNGASVNRTGAYGQMVTAFEEKYNCKVDMYGFASSEYTAGLTAQMAAGDPFEIVFMLESNFPSMVVSNLMSPLDGYVTTADLWNSKSATEGGLSYSYSNLFSLEGHLYTIAGAYLATPGCIWYNKKMFADAGYSGKDDPLELYRAGKFTWDKLYEMLSEIQDKENKLYGLNAIAPHWGHVFLGSFNANFVKKTSSGGIVQNLGDAQVYASLQMMKKFQHGEQAVCNPSDIYENGKTQFLNGTTAALLGNSGYAADLYKAMDKKTYAAFGTAATQKSNIGFVPMPVANKQGVHGVWGWMGYGAGNGASDEAKKAAVAFALNDSVMNHLNVYCPEMPEAYAKVSREVVDSDKLLAPMQGFKSSAGSCGNILVDICNKVCTKGQDITMTLKGYEKLLQTVINTALKYKG